MTLPERINVIKCITYNAQDIAKMMTEEEYEGEITLSRVLDRIEDWIRDDFGSTKGLVYQDENGEEL